ncbi:MAG: hypothetical protein ACKN9W_01475 [Methylococcus sp.]
MAIINFSDTSQQAFLRGFQKGLASPVMLFGSFQAPRMDAIPQISVPAIDAREALENDWRVIGIDLNNVIQRYVKEHSEKTTPAR